jgi:hypothetical protein
VRKSPSEGKGEAAVLWKKVSRRNSFGVAQSPKSLPAGRWITYIAAEESQQEIHFLVRGKHKRWRS